MIAGASLLSVLDLILVIDVMNRVEEVLFVFVSEVRCRAVLVQR